MGRADAWGITRVARPGPRWQRDARCRTGSAAPASASPRRRSPAAVAQQRAAARSRAPGPGRLRRVLDLWLNQLQERDPAVAGLARAIRGGGAHDRRRPRPGVPLGEAHDRSWRRPRSSASAIRSSRTTTSRSGSGSSPGPGPRRPRRPPGRDPLHAHRRGRLRGDGGDDPPAPRRARMTGARGSPWSLRRRCLLAIVDPRRSWPCSAITPLRQWHRSADELFHEQSRSMAVMVAEKVDMALRHAEYGIMGPARGGDPERCRRAGHRWRRSCRHTAHRAARSVRPEGAAGLPGRGANRDRAHRARCRPRARPVGARRQASDRR